MGNSHDESLIKNVISILKEKIVRILHFIILTKKHYVIIIIKYIIDMNKLY